MPACLPACPSARILDRTALRTSIKQSTFINNLTSRRSFVANGRLSFSLHIPDSSFEQKNLTQNKQISFSTIPRAVLEIKKLFTL